MKIERKKNAINGTITGIIVKLVQIVFPFILRTVFIKTLGIDYLGLNSLFASILQVLNLAELGVSSALVFSMYKPIAEDDTIKICELMNLYKRYYRIIGCVILIIGLIIVPFLPHLIDGDIPQDINLYIIYIMHLCATVLSYWLFSYRSALFSAHQRLDITNVISFFISLFTYATQVVCLLTVRNYYFYLLISIISQIVLNIIIAIASKIVYPDYYPNGVLPEEEKRIINNKVKDLFTAKVGGVINTAADTLVMSAFLGLKVIAIYQNYYYIVSSLMAFFNIFFAACTAGIGNSLVINSKDENRKLLYNLNHILFFALNFCCACLVSLFQPFMKLWVGKEYMLGFEYVILFAIYLYIEEGPRTMLNFKDAGGIWKKDRFRPLITAITNLVLNIILVNVMGLYGILLSTILSFGIVAFPWLLHNIHYCMFELPIVHYVLDYMTYVLVAIGNATICYYVNSLISVQSSIVDLVMRFIICIVISTLSFELVFWKKKENKYMLSILKSVLRYKNDQDS